jgi:periplasmic copper chaperone A
LKLHAALTALCLALCAVAHAAEPTPVLAVQDAWIRATPGVDVAAVYLTLHNTSKHAIVIVGARSPVASMAMIHESALVNGQSSMRPRTSVRIEPRATVQFAPGGLHIMLHGLNRSLAPQDDVALVLLLEGGGTLDFTARVRPLNAQ